MKLFMGVGKSNQSSLISSLVNKLDTEDLLELMSTLLATVSQLQLRLNKPCSSGSTGRGDSEVDG
jgi:hypothetical protein